jgi:hypothetical protein
MSRMLDGYSTHDALVRPNMQGPAGLADFFLSSCSIHSALTRELTCSSISSTLYSSPYVLYSVHHPTTLCPSIVTLL